MFREAKKILQVHRPQIMFLCETKLMSKQMQNKCRGLAYDSCFEVGRNGLGGGFAMMWDTNVTVEVKSYSMHHIDVVCIQKMVVIGDV